MTELSQNDRAIVTAYELGYRADEEGNLYNPEGKKLNPTMTNYTRFKVRGTPGKPLVHRFIAYQWFGEDVFGQLVRHLNDDPTDNRRDNLALGTPRDNYNDMPVEAKKRKADGTSRNLRKADEELVLKLIDEGKTHKQIKEITGTSTGVISRIRNGRRRKF